MLALMPVHTQINIDLAKITSFESVLANLTALDGQLSKNDLNEFVVFNRAYAVVTRDIQKGAHDNYFANPAFIEMFTTSFANIYFKVVIDVLAHNEVPAAWAALSKTSASPGFIPLLMGANAHINHDLPLVLVELIDKEKTNDLLSDVLKIDKLLMKSGKEIIGLFDEPNKYLDFMKRHFRFLYYRPIMYMILGWRISAWRSYKAITRVGLERSNYQRKSIHIANRLLRIGQLL